jgi:phosphoesterase RecJ-like protein
VDALPAGVQVDINIDHHLSNLEFGKINLIEPENVATSAIIAEHLKEWGLSINQSVASALLMDIGRFSGF